MKAVVALSALLVAVFLGVTEVDANCSLCPYRCYLRNCSYYACAVRNETSYCCCVECGSDNFYKIGHTVELEPRKQMNDQLVMEIRDYRP